MTEKQQKQRMILCGGLQSGGTTLISWCFLQRRDTNGVLDMPHDNLRVCFEKVTDPIVWCKMTIGAFRWLDVAGTYRDLGWNPEPLLVVRDVRAAFASLKKKEYGFNGTTAEEPPLRMRFRRFLSDWELFRANGWPMLRYEDLLLDEQRAFADVCRALGLPWDAGMTAWPKKLSAIAYVGVDPNRTFLSSIDKGSLAAAKMQEKGEVQSGNLPKGELAWLEKSFEAYNEFHHYPKHVAHAPAIGTPECLPMPRYEGTARHWYYSENERLRAENEQLSAGKRSEPNKPQPKHARAKLRLVVLE